MKYIKSVFDIVQNNLKKTHPRAANYSGSTALCGIIAHDNNKNKIVWLANVGDSEQLCVEVIKLHN